MNDADIDFDSQDPFPYLLPEPSYSIAKRHSALVDAWLGLRIDEVEGRLHTVEGQQLWVGLAPERMLTPYTEIRMLLELLRPPASNSRRK